MAQGGESMMMTATVADLLGQVEQRRAGETEDAGAAYAGLARRLAANAPGKGDTAQRVDAILSAAGRELSDLRRDVAALVALEDARAGLRALIEAEGRAALAGFKLSEAAHAEREGVIKLRDARQAASNAVTFAGRDVEALAAKVAPLLSLVPDALRERFQAARGAWSRADLLLREAKAAAAGWSLRPGFAGAAGAEPVPHGPEELARLEGEAQAAYLAVGAAAEELAAHEPTLAQVEAAGLRPRVLPAVAAPAVEAAARVEADEQHEPQGEAVAPDAGEDLGDDEQHADDAGEQGPTGGAA